MAQIETATERRDALPPDIKLGWLSLWIGASGRATWLDIAAEVRESSIDILVFKGPLIQQADLKPFVLALEGFAAGSTDEAVLASLGGSLRITLSRSKSGWMRLHAWLIWGRVEHNFTFGLWQEALDQAVSGARMTLARIEAARRGCRPRFLELFVRSGPGAPQPVSVTLPETSDRIEDWDSGITTGDIAFRYEIDGFGWYGVEVRVGDEVGEFGGGYLTDALGDMLRGALAMLAGAPSFTFMCHAEPGLTRVTFERVQTRGIGGTRMTARTLYGCRVLVQEINHLNGSDGTVEFDAVCHSPRALAEAIYRMAAPHFATGTHPTNPAALAALEGALVAVVEMEMAEDQASGAP